MSQGAVDRRGIVVEDDRCSRGLQVRQRGAVIMQPELEAKVRFAPKVEIARVDAAGIYVALDVAPVKRRDRRPRSLSLIHI